MNAFLTELITNTPLIPAAILCYLPMKNQIKPGWEKNVAIFLPLFVVLITFIIAYISAIYPAARSWIFYSMIPFLFAAYHFSLNTHISKSIHVFLFSFALACFSSNYSTGIEALIYPDYAYNPMEIHYIVGVIQFCINMAFVVLTAYPLYKYGSELIDRLDMPRVWNTISLVLIMFIICSIIMIPYNFQTLYTNHVFRGFWLMCFILLFMMLLIYVLFYFIATGILNASKNKERVHFLEMQQKQYIALKDYLEKTSRIRHDFRHTLGVLKELSEAGDYQSLDNYLAKYIQSMPSHEITLYTKNNAINAILNYYAQSAKQNHILLEWQIELPEQISIPDNDLCPILGNVLENSIHGCLSVPEQMRRQQLVITTRHHACLYIVSTNSFDGCVKQRNDVYLSTYKNGNGIGLSSIAAIVEQYHGSAQFHHDENNFYTDIMIPI